MNIKKLLLLVGIINAAVLLFILVLFSVNNRRVKSSLEHMVQVDQTLLLTLDDMYAQGLQTGQATRNILLNPEDEMAKSNYADAHEKFLKANETALRLASGKLLDDMKTVQELWAGDHRLKVEVQKLAEAGKQREAAVLLNSKETSQWRAVRKILLDRLEKQKDVFERRLDENRLQSARSTKLLAFVIVLSFLAFNGFLAVVNGKTQKSMRQALSCFEAIEHGELTEARMIRDGRNILKDVFNRIVVSLRDTVRRIGGVAGNVTRDVGAMLEKISAADQGSKEQLAQVGQVASAAAEMSQSIGDVAKSAAHASDAARDASGIAQKGKETVSRASAAIREIAESVAASARTMEQLGRSTREIGEIVAIINSIADHTNLLALNAAIEAARAGEQGRGFAVVADEVRKLSENTTKATKDISEKIKSIQEQSVTSVAAMERCSKGAEGGVTHADVAVRALDEIVAAVQKAMDMIQRIAAAAEEQSSTSEEIARNMEIITGLVNRSTDMLHETRLISDRLSGHAQDLEQSIGWFRV